MSVVERLGKDFKCAGEIIAILLSKVSAFWRVSSHCPDSGAARAPAGDFLLPLAHSSPEMCLPGPCNAK